MRKYSFFVSAVISVLLLCMLNSCNEKMTDIENSHELTDETEQQTDLPENQDAPETFEEYDAELTLYFPDSEAMYLHPETRNVTVKENIPLEQVVLDELFKGPSDEKLAPSLDGENLVISVSTDEEGLCIVDFTGDFVVLNSGGTTREVFAIGSIVNSLCELENVNSVKINIEGKTDAEFGHSLLDAVILPRLDLVKE